MSTCSVRISQGSSASCVLPAEAISPKIYSNGRLHPSAEISSHWNCSGRLSFELQKQPSLWCGTGDDQGRCSVYCVHSLKDARGSLRSKQNVPPVFPINLSSLFGGWLTRLFNGIVSVEDRSNRDKVLPDSQQGGFESFLLKYQAEKDLDSLQTYIMQPFKDTSCAPYSPRDSDALKVAPYLDMLHRETAEISAYEQCISGGEISSLTRSQMIKHRVSQTHYFVTADQLGSADALASWLSGRLPSGVSQWGTAPGTKRVVNLWTELKDGETVLEDSSPPRRTVHIASVKIKNKSGQMLVEAHQEMADGSVRFRNRPLSEKMRPGEKVEEACFRGIFEELGSHLGAENRVRIVSGSYIWKQEERESLSYPGLLTRYVIHSVDAMVEDLPDTGFYTVENEHSLTDTGQLSSIGGCACNGAAVGVRKHFWQWISPPS